MRLSASTRRWLARLLAPRKRKPRAPAGKRRAASMPLIVLRPGTANPEPRSPSRRPTPQRNSSTSVTLINGRCNRAGKRRHSPVERLHFAKPWDPEARGGRGGWKPFIRATMGKSGAYAIRHSGGTYVGSSNAGRLYRTMVRHLEEWGRDKDFWAEAENRTHGAPGETFDREAVEVAVIRCPADQAHALEAELIQRLRSATNEQSPPGEPVAKLTDEVPF